MEFWREEAFWSGREELKKYTVYAEPDIEKFREETFG